MKGHYLMLVLSVGKADFERVYLPLAHVDETVEEATERWLDQQVAGRQRNVAKARAQAAARIESSRICRPSSWYREQCELAGVEYPRPVGRTQQRRKRAA